MLSTARDTYPPNPNQSCLKVVEKRQFGAGLNKLELVDDQLSWLSSNDTVSSRLRSTQFTEYPDAKVPTSAQPQLSLLEGGPLDVTHPNITIESTPDNVDFCGLHSPLCDGDGTNDNRVQNHKMPHYYAYHKPQAQQYDHTVLQKAVDNERSLSTFQTDVPSSYEPSVTIDIPAVDELLGLTMYSQGVKRQHDLTIPFPIHSILGKRDERGFGPTITRDTMNFETDVKDRKYRGKRRMNPKGELTMTQKICGTTSVSLDKKEIRARRNRESARRSRMKSKQHFQALEKTFVFMHKENKALRILVERLLPQFIEKNPQLSKSPLLPLPFVNANVDQKLTKKFQDTRA